ncbi:MAG: hypothetical protein ABEJ70_05870 [Halobacteriaceae archaeon]
MAGATDRGADTWVYESLVGAVPGVDLSDGTAVAVQFGAFEAAVLALAAVDGRWWGALAGTAAVAVAAVGSAFMLDLGARTRALDLPPAYTRLLFGSSVEVVLGLLAYVGLLTYLFVYDPRAGPTLLGRALGPSPSLAGTYVALLVLWDVCYRIGTGWWAALTALWRTTRFAFDPATRRSLAAVDRRTVGFGVLQLALVPFVADHPVLTVALGGHVAAVVLVAGSSALLLRRT